MRFPTRVLTGMMLAAVALAASGCAHQPPPVSTAFGDARTLNLGESARYDDGLGLKLEVIDDSRCGQGMVCVWAGELSPQLKLSGGRFGDTPATLRLGTGRGRDRQIGGYRIELLQATPQTATLVVTRP